MVREIKRPLVSLKNEYYIMNEYRTIYGPFLSRKTAEEAAEAHTDGTGTYTILTRVAEIEVR